ncbi:ABC-2 transporter permease [Candidatus Arthromitus sp. SFB-rat-Yit]|uniref:ABC-2 transporter permease n=1 Tax=Candidatus Arthromitus sp. SFB-rat-Yit TaxID=1041504 RepID=UPI000227A06A|nr:ABC-2 transporter permease [Candidatus Arthromitus sp. SFB-rat-Yit]BAK81205.1 hypothetical protein RATSFB_0643 [Candidatus Arthromitus sp. SFB-rat-Yit]
MSNILKLSKLDFDLVKPYLKSLYLKMIIPIFFVAISQSLTAGISFAMFLVVTTITSYIFSVTEKNSMERFYSVLPIKKSEEVIGRYIFVIISGLVSLIFYLIFQYGVLVILNKSISIYEIIFSGFIGIVLFTFSAVFQLPGYYKFGFIKGKVFMYIPLLLFFITNFSSINLTKLFQVIGYNSPILLISSLIIFVVIAWIISILISINILKNREM